MSLACWHSIGMSDHLRHTESEFRGSFALAIFEAALSRDTMACPSRFVDNAKITSLSYLQVKPHISVVLGTIQVPPTWRWTTVNNTGSVFSAQVFVVGFQWHQVLNLKMCQFVLFRINETMTTLDLVCRKDTLQIDDDVGDDVAQQATIRARPSGCAILVFVVTYLDCLRCRGWTTLLSSGARVLRAFTRYDAWSPSMSTTSRYQRQYSGNRNSNPSAASSPSNDTMLQRQYTQEWSSFSVRVECRVSRIANECMRRSHTYRTKSRVCEEWNVLIQLPWGCGAWAIELRCMLSGISSHMCIAGTNVINKIRSYSSTPEVKRLPMLHTRYLRWSGCNVCI